MKRKWGKLFLIMLLAAGIAGGIRPVHVQAASVTKAQNAVRAYNKYVTAKKYRKYTKTTKYLSFLTDPENANLYNYLPDLNHDGVPELILQNEIDGTIYVFTYRQKQVKYVRKIKTKYKTDLPATLMYHGTKRQVWTLEMDMSKMEKLMTEMLASDTDLESVNTNEMVNKLLDALDIGIRESLYKVSASGRKISKVKNTELRMVSYTDGILFKMNGKERLRCGIYINDKTLSQLDYSDENMKFDSMRMDFQSPGSKKLSLKVSFGGITVDQIADMDLDKLEKKIKLSYYYGDKKITEKQAEKKLNEMINFIMSMKSTSDDAGSFVGYSLTKYCINTYLVPRPEKMRMTYSWVRLRVGQSSTPKVRYSIPSDACKEMTFISQNPKIARITANGRIKAVKAGKTKVTAINTLNPACTFDIRVIAVK